jgi:hypothetical protein
MRDNTITLQTLKAQKVECLKELQALDKLIEVYEGKSQKEKDAFALKVSDTLLSTREKVVNVAIDLVYKNRRPIASKEIFEVVKKTKILKDMKDEQATLAAILNQEVNKKSARLKKVARGVYAVK